MTDHLQAARDHLAEGEALLKQGAARICDGTPSEIHEANAHFMASMAHTNLLLVDPAEAPEPVQW